MLGCVSYVFSLSIAVSDAGAAAKIVYVPATIDAIANKSRTTSCAETVRA